MNCVAREAIRQRREAFEQRKVHDERWFTLCLTMGYVAIFLLAAILSISAYVVFHHDNYPETVLTAAFGTVFAEAAALIVGVWKIALAPSPKMPLEPMVEFPTEKP